MMEEENKFLKSIKMNQEKDYNSILLEELRGDIKALAEGQSVLDRKIDEKFGEVMAEISDLKSDVSGLKSDVSDLKSDVSDLKSGFADFQSGQSQVLDYLARIEDEIQALRKDLEENYEKKGWDAAWRKQIEDKLERIEKSLENRNFSGGMVAGDK